MPQRTCRRRLLEQVFEDSKLAVSRLRTETSSTFATLALLRSGDGAVGLIPMLVANILRKAG